MFLLDTNVLSALMSVRPDPSVAAWVSTQPAELLFTAAVCQAEILAGLAILPEGRRGDALEAAARQIFGEDFAGRILSFDKETAEAYAEIFAARSSAGQSVTTRDVSDFDCSARILNPWAP